MCAYAYILIFLSFYTYTYISVCLSICLSDLIICSIRIVSYLILSYPILSSDRIWSYPICSESCTNLPTYLPTYLPIWIHTYMNTWIHAYVHTYIHTSIQTYVHTWSSRSSLARSLAAVQWPSPPFPPRRAKPLGEPWPWCSLATKIMTWRLDTPRAGWFTIENPYENEWFGGTSLGNLRQAKWDDC